MRQFVLYVCRDCPSEPKVAWEEMAHRQALAELTALANELERSHPGAAASLREGLEETLTVTRLGVRGALKRTLESTNPCEVRRTWPVSAATNTKRWISRE